MWIFTLMLVAVSAGCTAIAVTSTLLTATAGRVRDFRVLRLSGATPRRVLLALTAETCCAITLGAALGLAAAAPALLGPGQRQLHWQAQLLAKAVDCADSRAW
ncbi:hypothetical protein ACIBU0_07670 [Streptomyces sp. NPDC049627]|uniref:hypothetical protein n=1 Tax=Streptomyces sp. NPDC049627 TaxID=3365595 RepID=UPI0037A346E7